MGGSTYARLVFVRNGISRICSRLQLYIHYGTSPTFAERDREKEAVRVPHWKNDATR